MAKSDSNSTIIYLLVNRHERYVVSHGISFQDFIWNLNTPPLHILLLSNRFNESEYHLHTQLDYVSSEQLPNLLKKEISALGDFCWVDFEDVFDLDELDGQELAELLYLGHMKRHLVPPFYQKLNNRFAYLTNNDGWMNKIYFRNWNDFYNCLGRFIPYKMKDVKWDGLFSPFRKKKEYPVVEKVILQQLNTLMTEGFVISFQSVSQSRNQLALPFFTVGDFYDMEEMLESYRSQSKPKGYFLYDKKAKMWSISFVD
ncbi:hypothetical protein [Fervidibacillus halotolerans]|uniref:Oxalate:formate antiporter n=1 Tax=Fervidibacillus halotolerans TaxID=2980027 RepID=A0A9E8LZG4_9BACI|nr:hypothetical protein [Fervidibacillus halotolerans]WAA12552.1 hypothetical protein OE105_13700 [Fervidibacillus halotolerans]